MGHPRVGHPGVGAVRLAASARTTVDGTQRWPVSSSAGHVGCQNHGWRNIAVDFAGCRPTVGGGQCMSGGAFRYLVALSAALGAANCRWRPYRVECTGSLPTSEVKRRRARLVLGWGTAREDLRVLPAFRFNRAVLRLGRCWCCVSVVASCGGLSFSGTLKRSGAVVSVLGS